MLHISHRDHDVDLWGPTRDTYRWQGRDPEGYGISQFQIDWRARQAICPEGKVSSKWSDAIDSHGKPVIKVGWAHRDCSGCPSRVHCTQSSVARRTITLRPQAHHEALVQARLREADPGFELEYAARAGIEGTLSQGVRRCDLRHSRYFGRAKTHLHHVLTAAALNFIRVAEWFQETPRAATRQSAFVRLMLNSTS